YAFSFSAHPLLRGKTNHSVSIGRVLGFCALLETLCILPLQFRLPRGLRFPVDSTPCSIFLLLALGFLLSPLRLMRLLLSLQSLALSSLLSLQFLALSLLRGFPCLRVCCLFRRAAFCSWRSAMRPSPNTTGVANSHPTKSRRVSGV